MDTPHETAKQGQSNSDSTDSEDDVPLVRLKESKTIHEDGQPRREPTNESENHETGKRQEIDEGDTQRALSPCPIEFNSDYESPQDSDADPEFSPGICDVRRCKEDVWAACEECEMLLCYDHFLEEVTSCEKHGKVKKKDRQKSNRKEKLAQFGEKVDSLTAEKTHETREEPIIESENPKIRHIMTGERQEMEQGGKMREMQRGEEGLVVRVEPEEAGLDKEGQREEERRIEEGETQNEPGRGRKRTRNEENWARTVKKRLKNTGKPYISSRGKEVAGKSMKATYSETCALKCSTKFNEEERKSLFDEFWSSADKREQHHFLLRHAQELPVKRIRVGSEKRTTTFHYYFHKADARKEEVCRTFFLNTLDIKRDLVYNVVRRQTTVGGLRPSYQGKHGQQKKNDETILQGVKNHINSFPVIESHYCRARTKRNYLDPFLSVAAMYRLYSNQCDEKGLEKVSEDKYRKVFDYNFNLGFHRPKKDQCEVCIAHKNQKGFATAQENQVYESHMNNKVIARQIKDSVKKDACNLSTTTGCAFDLQQILLCPHGKSSAFFYKRRLGVYNLTVYDFKKGDAYCFMWPENEGRRGSNEVATCLFKYIEIQSHQGVKDITMFSDNSAGQNRNRFVAFALNFARAHFKLNTITHTFLEKGHTETENDSVHATIEKKSRNMEIYSPEQWFTVVRAARTSKQPYVVNEMTSCDFIDFKGMASKVRNLSLDDSGEKISWSKAWHISSLQNYFCSFIVGYSIVYHFSHSSIHKPLLNHFERYWWYQHLIFLCLLSHAVGKKLIT